MWQEVCQKIFSVRAGIGEGKAHKSACLQRYWLVFSVISKETKSEITFCPNTSIKHSCSEQGTSLLAGVKSKKIRLFRIWRKPPTLICSSAEYVYLSIWLRPTSVSHSKLNSRDAAALIMPLPNRLITIYSLLNWINTMVFVLINPATPFLGSYHLFVVAKPCVHESIHKCSRQVSSDRIDVCWNTRACVGRVSIATIECNGNLRVFSRCDSSISSRL